MATVTKTTVEATIGQYHYRAGELGGQALTPSRRVEP
jgi:hypothetical protein